MKVRLLAIVAAGVLGWANQAPAQEKQPEKIPPPEALPPVAAPAVEPGCDTSCGPHGVKILWLERERPIQVLTPREVITDVKRPTLTVLYRDVKRTVIETVMKPREVTREIPFTTMKPCVEVCPTTGECHTVMKPCTEMRVVKDTVFYPDSVKREIIEKVPYLKEVEEVLPQRTILLEYRTEMQKHGSAIAIPYEEPRDRWLLAPNPCPDPHHP